MYRKIGFGIIISCVTLLTTQVFAARPSFTSLQQQINQLNAEINQLTYELEESKPVSVKSNGQIIGQFAHIEFATTEANTISPKGYAFEVLSDGSMIYGSFFISQYFETLDCSGPVYAAVINYPSSTSFIGRVARLQGQPGLFYLPGQPPINDVLVQSYFGANSSPAECAPAPATFPPSYIGFTEMLPNDPAVTGVENSYETPITVGY